MKVSTKSRRPKRAPTDAETIRAASELYHDEGRIEIDLMGGLPRGRVSRAAGNACGGAYVLAWVWVSDEEAHRARKEGTNGKP